MTKLLGVAVMESRRLGILTALNEITGNVRSLASGVVDVIAMAHSRTGQSHPLNAVTTAAQRRVIVELIRLGTKPQVAAAATLALVDYCHDHKIEPGRILVSELPRIHPALLPKALELLQSVSSDPSGLSIAETASKQLTMERSRSLLAQLTAAAGPTVLALLVLGATSVFGGCGLKTKPKSDIVNFRPDIPFRETAKPAPASTR